MELKEIPLKKIYEFCPELFDDLHLLLVVIPSGSKLEKHNNKIMIGDIIVAYQ